MRKPVCTLQNASLLFKACMLVNNASYQMNLGKRFLKGGAVYRADLRIFFGMAVSMASCIMERV